MKLFKKSCLVLAALVAVGCSSTNNYSGNEQDSKVAYKDNVLYKDFSKSEARTTYEKNYGGRPHLDKIGGNRVPAPSTKH